MRKNTMAVQNRFSSKTNAVLAGVVVVATSLAMANCSTDPVPTLAPKAAEIAKPGDPNAGLPFNPDDPAATFSARVTVEGEGGAKVAGATLTVDGKPYTTDVSGEVSVANVLVRNDKGASLSAPGYLPTSVLLTYASAGTNTLRVALRRARANVTFAASAGGTISDSPMSVSFSADSFTTADGMPYTGQVRVAARGLDPLREVVSLSAEGSVTYREGFDPASVPLGFDRAQTKDGKRKFLYPEAAFQLELTDDSGAPLKLKSGKEAVVRLKLSPLTKRNVGDVVPLFQFDNTQHRWVETGSCTVADRDGGKECVGSASHFSAYAVPAADDGTEKCFRGVPVWQGFTADQEKSRKDVTYTVQSSNGDVVAPITDHFQLNAITGAARVHVTVAYTIGLDRFVYEFGKGGTFSEAPVTQPFDRVAAATLQMGGDSVVGTKFVCAPTMLVIAHPASTKNPDACMTCAAPQRCSPTKKACVTLPACANETKDGDETDSDCGGATCERRCASGGTCVSPSDCESGLACSAGKCGAKDSDGGDGGDSGDGGDGGDSGDGGDGGSPMCTGSNTNPLCGGNCPLRCTPGFRCNDVMDCEMGLECTMNVCTIPGGPGAPGAPGMPGMPGP